MQKLLNYFTILANTRGLSGGFSRNVSKMLGGLPLLLKSFLENNVEEDFLSKIHAVGDVMTALKMKSDKYKNEDSVQKMYKELKPECNNKSSL